MSYCLLALLTVLLCVCGLQTVEQQMDKNSEKIYRRAFKFSDGEKIKIQVEIPGFQHAIIAINPSKEV